MKTTLRLALVLPLIALLGCDRNSSDQKTGSKETPEAAAMSFAPAVPPPIVRTKPAHVVIDLAVTEEERSLADGVTYEFWSYNGHTPGPFIRLRVGDRFEVRLDNSKGKLTHTVDFHAVTGPGLATFSSNKGYLEKPEYIVFNGHAQALTGKGSLQAKVGETTRLYVGNIGPNLTSSFHVIGEIFDRVYREGSLANPESDVQTTLIPAGGAAIVDFQLQVPGDYALVDHSIFRTDRGALGILSVTGDPGVSVFNSHKTSTGPGH